MPRLISSAFFVLSLLSVPVLQADAVKVTPLGARTGEFCSGDRAILFEDPTGVRILYDPANTVAGSDDSRLRGDIDVVLVSHAHGDHIGTGRLNQDPNASNASCGQAPSTPVPSTNAAEIIARRNAVFVGTSELGTFIASKIQQQLGVTVTGCSTSPSNETIVPNGTPCTANLGYGAKRIIRKSSASNGVRIAMVPAVHGNAIGNNLLSDPLASSLASNGLSLAPGTASGYILQFTNGLSVYLTGDTGLSGDMLQVVRRFYRPDLVVFNIGDIFTTGPEEAAFAINELINPAAVIPSHANEVATSGGQIVPGTKTARFAQLVDRADVIPPLSGQTLEFDGAGQCLSGGGTPRKRRPRN